MNRLKECMNGDKLLDNVGLAELLRVTKDFGTLPAGGRIKYYSMEENEKPFYLASEIQSFLLQRGKNTNNKK